MKISKMFGIATVALVASFASANAQQGVRVGVLECTGGQNVSFVVGSNATLNCVFQSEGGRAEGYVATVRRFGLDLGFTQNTTVQWAAFAPYARVPRGALAGSYGGVGSNASVGVGFGGNFLLGGNGNQFTLQPLSVQGQTGLNVAAGIVSLDLTPAAPVRARRHMRKHHRHH
ncbi:DUF992 domain-containing protein [Tardiphaga sp.]|uniref:DUF992 domain-containing protein n=1 Tax=Tardiphaga sp. TaxID=1926292 RepID=UPI00260521AD|nr:DUF992 domain-containing protein [Tardiphaga sp.]MDB5618434.1 hypothetical protein [Tardiphaga sp.]